MPQEDVDDLHRHLPNTCEGYDIKGHINADDTGLLFVHFQLAQWRQKEKPGRVAKDQKKRSLCS